MFALEFAQVGPLAGAPLPVPSSLEELVRARVARLPPAVLPLLAVVAAAGRPTTAVVEAVIDDPSALLDAAAAGAVTIEDSPVRSSSFHLPVMEHLEHGYSLREITTHLVCSVTTVPPTCPRLRRRGTELVGTGRGWNEEDLTPTPTRRQAVAQDVPNACHSARLAS